jgi:hypothetical protein
LTSNASAAQTASATDDNVRFDVHHHFLPPGNVAIGCSRCPTV